MSKAERRGKLSERQQWMTQMTTPSGQLVYAAPPQLLAARKAGAGLGAE